MVSKIYLLRHGHRFDFAYPEWFNTALRRYDPPLSLEGSIQVQKLAKTLINLSIDHIIVSPFLRTIQTGHIIGEILDLPIKLETGLGEWHNPAWMSEKPEIHPPEELKLFYPLIDWQYQSKLTPRYPETKEMVLARMKDITCILQQEFNGNLLLVGHSITVEGIRKALSQKNEEIFPSFASLWEFTITSNNDFFCKNLTVENK